MFPLMARYQNTWRSHMKNAMLVGVGNLPRMLLIWLIWAVPVGACLVFPWLRLYLSLVWLLIGVQQSQLCDGSAAAAGVPAAGAAPRMTRRRTGRMRPDRRGLTA